MTVINERFVHFDETGKKSAVIAEIIVDTADELPETNGISGEILHQGSVAYVVKQGGIYVLSEDGEWCDISGKPVEKLVGRLVSDTRTAGGTIVSKVTEEEEND